MVHDELRRVFVPKYFRARVLDEAPENVIRIKLDWQIVSRASTTIGSVGPSLGITPFDEFGRRIYRMQTKTGPLAVVQGITELTPHYVKVESLRGPIALARLGHATGDKFHTTWTRLHKY